MSKPDWYREPNYDGTGYGYRLPDTPSMRAHVRASNVMKGLNGKYPYGLSRFCVRGKSNRQFLEKMVDQGLWEIVKVIPSGDEFIVVITSTRKEKIKELVTAHLKVGELEKMLNIK